MKKRIPYTSLKISMPKLNFRQKVFASILLFSVLPFVVLFSVYLINSYTTHTNELKYLYRDKLKSGAETLGNLFGGSIQKLFYINANIELKNLLKSEFNGDFSVLYENFEKAEKIINAVTVGTENENVRLYALKNKHYNGTYISSIETLDQTTRESILSASNDTMHWRIGNEFVNGTAKDIKLYQKVTDIDETIGIVEISILFSNCIEPFSFEIPVGSVILYHAPPHAPLIVRQTNEKEAVSITDDMEQWANHNKYEIIDCSLKYTDHEIVMLMPNKYFSQSFYKLMMPQILLILVVLLFIHISVYWTSKRLTSYLTKLIDNMNADAKNGFTAEDFLKMDRGGYDEFNQIILKFCEHNNIIKEYYEKVSSYEMQNKTLELKLLQERINPHFLYNTLSAVKWVCVNEQLWNVVDSMVKYYRLALNGGNETVTLFEEIEMIKEYVNLQKFAYNSSYNFEIHMQEHMNDVKILRQLLQPIVENAILHGLNGLESGGNLIIKVEQKEDVLCFIIKDTGVGMSKEKLAQVIKGENRNLYSGYGMKNIRERLKIYYGEGSSLKIESVENNGTIVTITIPNERIKK